MKSVVFDRYPVYQTHNSNPSAVWEAGGNTSLRVMHVPITNVSFLSWRAHTAGTIIAINNILSRCKSDFRQKQQSKPQTKEN